MTVYVKFQYNTLPLIFYVSVQFLHMYLIKIALNNLRIERTEY